MPRVIVIKPRATPQVIEAQARELLETGFDTGDDAVLDAAIKIADQEGLDVAFRLDQTGGVIDPDMAYRLRFERGTDIRYLRPVR